MTEDNLKKFVEELDTRVKKLEGEKKPEEKKGLEQTFDEQVFGKKKEQ